MISGVPIRRWKKSDSFWLVLAVFAHAALLLIPLKGSRPQDIAQAPLIISLTPFSSTAARRSPADTRNAPATVNTAEVFPGVIAPAAPAKPESLKPTPPPIQKRNGKPVPPVLTTAGLMSSARTMLLDRRPPGDSSRLGVYIPKNPPYNWRPGAGAEGLQPGDNWFSGMSVPARTEIVDRWLAADGSHNVVVNLPNGQTICGRAESWNPLQALVEHIMMFHPCGGGGKRTFSMSALKSASGTKSEWAKSLD